METMIPAWTYNQVWRRYERYCRLKQLNPFSDIALAVWTYDLSVKNDAYPFLPPEVEIIDDIISAAKMTG